MIETIYLEIIILLFMVYFFENKILPQVIIIFLTMVMLLNQISISTDLQGDIGILVLYSCIVLYGALQIFTEKKLE